MKFEAGKTYKTRGGEDAYIYAVDAPGPYPIHGRIGEDIRAWKRDGSHIDKNVERICDLMPPAPPRVSRLAWANVDKDGNIGMYYTEAGAKEWAHDRIARLAVPCRLEEIVE